MLEALEREAPAIAITTQEDRKAKAKELAYALAQSGWSQVDYNEDPSVVRMITDELNDLRRAIDAI